jgi:hypothetical protein
MTSGVWARASLPGTLGVVASCDDLPGSRAVRRKKQVLAHLPFGRLSRGAKWGVAALLLLAPGSFLIVPLTLLARFLAARGPNARQ